MFQPRVTRYSSGRWSDASAGSLDSPQTLVFAFGDSALLDEPQPFDQLRAMFPLSVIVGASGSGTISGLDVLDNLLNVTAVRFEATDLRFESMPVDEAGNARDCGRTIGRRLMSRPGLQAVYVLADGLQVNGPDLVSGLSDVLPESIAMAGGMAGDGLSFHRTWTLVDGKPCQGHAGAVGFYGDRFVMHRGCRGGSIGFGPRRLVTRAKGNVVHCLDGEPVLRLYKEFLGDFANLLPAGASHFPLSVFRNADDTEAVIRFVLGVAEEDQSITVAGDIPEGSFVQLSRANPGDLLQGSMMAAVDVVSNASPDLPVLNLVVSCVGRRLVLGEQTDEELEASLEQLPSGSVQSGFYSYGEISSTRESRCDMHNMTLTLTTLAEA